LSIAGVLTGEVVKMDDVKLVDVSYFIGTYSKGKVNLKVWKSLIFLKIP